MASHICILRILWFPVAFLAFCWWGVGAVAIMPTTKPDMDRVEKLKASSGDALLLLSSNYTCQLQAFYDGFLNTGDYRIERFMELGKLEGKKEEEITRILMKHKASEFV